MPLGPLAILSLVAVLTGAGAYIVSRRRRSSPIDRERKRRTTVNAEGRLVEGNVTEVRDGVLFYSYSWRGIDYETSQAVDGLDHLLPADSNWPVGPVTVKFLPANPYNSIVLCESWSGFRRKTE